MSSIPDAIVIVSRALTQNATATEIVDRLIASGHIVGARPSHMAAYDAQFRAAGGTAS